jgi:glycosyltransferase involved in cell wall biosynthesis
MRLLIVFYITSIVEDYYTLTQDGGGTVSYGYMKYFIESITNLTERVNEIIVLNSVSDKPYDVVLTPGVRVVGTGFDSGQETKKLIKLIAEINPSHMIIRVATPEIFRWAANNHIPVAACLADSFHAISLKTKFRNYILAQELNRKVVEWISNHGINSCLDLQRIGVDPDKIIPWDFPHDWDVDFEPKEIKSMSDCWNLIYVGSIHESKGVGDILRGIKILAKKGVSVRLKLAGKGNVDFMKDLTDKLGIAGLVDFLGSVPNNHVIELMNQSDIVVIPSRRDYPEGFPLTIFEALKSRTPIVASDHSMFQGYLENHKTAMVFPSGRSDLLAARVEELISNPKLYVKLSKNSKEVWQTLQLPVKWHTFLNACIDSWLHNSSDAQQWLFQHRLTSGIYDLQKNYVQQLSGI